VIRKGEEKRWHLDKDELLWQNARQMRHPLISSVYYPAHCACEGGELMIDDVSVIPTPDTLVAFAGNLRHRVCVVTKGERWSIAMNFFATVPEGYRERPRD
jgi:predicted 2-oxoglutarate/Fe(II)-dependent dioxygenase YbiX